MGGDIQPVALRYSRGESVDLELPEREVEELVLRTVPLLNSSLLR